VTPLPPDPGVAPVPDAPPDDVSPPEPPPPPPLELLHADIAVTSTAAAPKPQYFLDEVDRTGAPRGAHPTSIASFSQVEIAIPRLPFRRFSAIET
jgi:hypothetical protein